MGTCPPVHPRIYAHASYIIAATFSNHGKPSRFVIVSLIITIVSFDSSITSSEVHTKVI